MHRLSQFDSLCIYFVNLLTVDYNGVTSYQQYKNQIITSNHSKIHPAQTVCHVLLSGRGEFYSTII